MCRDQQRRSLVNVFSSAAKKSAPGTSPTRCDGLTLARPLKLQMLSQALALN
jgi:hypothetical protein